MELRGPLGSVTGKRAAGYTDSKVAWQHAREMRGGVCRLIDLDVRVAIVITLPERVRLRSGRSALAVQWKGFMEKLRQHEATHRQHGLQAAAAVRQAILAIPPQADCRSLERPLTAPPGGKYAAMPRTAAGTTRAPTSARRKAFV